MHRQTLRSVCLLSTAVTLSLTACSLDLRRSSEAPPGEIRGAAIRDDTGEAAPFARIDTPGSNFIRHTDTSGNFRVGPLEAGDWVLRITDDADGDGLPDRARVLRLHLATEHVTSGLFGQNSTDAVGGLSLGNVPLQGTYGLRGQVQIDPNLRLGDNIAVKVLAVRYTCLSGQLETSTEFDAPGDCPPLGSAQSVERLSLGAEASTFVDPGGVFLFRGLIAGDIYFIAFAFEVDADGRLGKLLALSRPSADPYVGVPASAQAPAYDYGSTLLIDTPPDGVAATRFVLVPGGNTTASVITVPVGKPAPSCNDTVQNGASFGGAYPYAYRFLLVPDASGLPAADLPLGFYDLYVCGDQNRTGVAYQQAIFPLLTGQDAHDVGPVLLHDSENVCERCETGRCLRDCDDDNLEGLPILAPGPDYQDGAAVWSACAQQCAFVPGSSTPALGALANESCEVNGQIYDCDDDGDGQPDATEPQACYGLGRGTNLDGDNLCSTDDARSGCTLENAATCPAGTFELHLGNPYATPDTPDAGTPDAGPGIIDAGPGIIDAGPGIVDAGPGIIDAGPGIVDAGALDAGPGIVDAGPVYVDAGPSCFAETAVVGAGSSSDGGVTDAGVGDAGVSDAGAPGQGVPIGGQNKGRFVPSFDCEANGATASNCSSTQAQCNYRCAVDADCGGQGFGDYCSGGLCLHFIDAADCGQCPGGFSCNVMVQCVPDSCGGAQDPECPAPFVCLLGQCAAPAAVCTCTYHDLNFTNGTLRTLAGTDDAAVTGACGQAESDLYLNVCEQARPANCVANVDCTGLNEVCLGAPAGVCAKDTDNDTVADLEDNCVSNPNPDQSDLDADGLGDACDFDVDGDGVFSNDNCERVPNPAQTNSDNDPFGDACDNCEGVTNPDQSDVDGDGFGDVCGFIPGPVMPNARGGFALGDDGGALVAFGGFTALTGTALAAVDKVSYSQTFSSFADPGDGTAPSYGLGGSWLSVGSLMSFSTGATPAPRWGAQVVQYFGSLYLNGGSDVVDTTYATATPRALTFTLDSNGLTTGGNMNEPRVGHSMSMVQLPIDGLVADPTAIGGFTTGGLSQDGEHGSGSFWLLLSTSTFGTFNPSGIPDGGIALHTVYEANTATTFSGVQLLLIGGIDGNGAHRAQILLRDPQANMVPEWTQSAGFALAQARAEHTGTGYQTATGEERILVVGGVGDGGVVVSESEIVDATNGVVLPADAGGLNLTRVHHTATKVGTDCIVIAGGEDQAGNPLSSTVIFDIPTETFRPGPNLSTGRAWHQAALIRGGSDGVLLIVGGVNATGDAEASTEQISTVVLGCTLPPQQ